MGKEDLINLTKQWTGLRKEKFEQIYGSYFDPVRSYLYYRCGDTELATDIAQEVFLLVWEKKHKIGQKKLKGLLFKMAGDMFANKHKKAKVETGYLESIRFSQACQPPDGQLEYGELKANYEKALAALPEKQRVVFLMSRMENLKYQEIAGRLQVSVKTVEKRMSNALLYLKTVLKQ